MELQKLLLLLQNAATCTWHKDKRVSWVTDASPSV